MQTLIFAPLGTEPHLVAIVGDDRHAGRPWIPPSCFFQAAVRRCAYRSNTASLATRWRSSIFVNGVLLLPIADPWQMLEAGLEAFEPGFVLSRDQPEPQMRDAIDP